MKQSPQTLLDMATGRLTKQRKKLKALPKVKPSQRGQRTLPIAIPKAKPGRYYLTLTVEQALSILATKDHPDLYEHWTEATLLKHLAEIGDWIGDNGKAQWIIAQFIRNDGSIEINYRPPAGVVYILTSPGNSRAPQYIYGKPLNYSDPMIEDIIRNRVAAQFDV